MFGFTREEATRGQRILMTRSFIICVSYYLLIKEKEIGVTCRMHRETRNAFRISLKT
jgi:hypothetical protein